MKIDHILLRFAKQDECVLGEALLEYAFPGDGRGCYSNFELRDSFVPFPEGVDKYKNYLLGSIYEVDEDYPEEFHCPEELKRIHSFIDSETNLKVAWFWDGDGHLIFESDDFCIENPDIKKSSRWRKA
jgi:hypothetical protein